MLLLKNKYHCIFVALSCLFLIINAAFSQSTQIRSVKPDQNVRMFQQNKDYIKEQRLYRTAQSYISMKNYAAAIRILRQLHQEKPSNIMYYHTLLRVYLIVGMLDDAQHLNDEMQQLNPGDPRIKIDQANIYFRLDQKDRAFDLWEGILKSHPEDLAVYSYVANTMLENKLYDEAIKVYQEAIQRIPKSFHLYQIIASIYQSRLMYKEAAQAFLKYLEAQPSQQQYVFNRILSFQINPEEREDFFKMLEDYVKKSKQSDSIRLLMAQLYQRYREYKKAFRLYQQLDNNQKDSRYLLQFARAAETDSSFEIALEAYKLVIEKYPEYRNLMDAYTGAVRTLFGMAEQEENIQYANQAMQLIEDAEVRFKNHPYLPSLIYLKGVFKLNYFFDVDGALAVFNNLIHRKKISAKYKDLSLIRAGECQIIKGQLREALKYFQLVEGKQQIGQAKLYMAKTYYFLNEWEKATEVLAEIIKKEGVKGEITNDALALKIKLSFVQTAPEVLRQLSEAELLIFQRKKSEAIERLCKVIEISELPALFKSEVYEKIVRLSLSLNNISEAIEYCTKAIQDSSMVFYADQHLFLLGQILEENLQEYEEAFKTYRKLLENYPNSLYANQVRERMKFLKKEKIPELP